MATANPAVPYQPCSESPPMSERAAHLGASTKRRARESIGRVRGVFLVEDAPML